MKFPRPARFSSERPDQPLTYDVVYVSEWRKFGGPQRSMVEEIRALVASGRRVAIAQLEAARFMAKSGRYLHPSSQALVNEGLVDEVALDDVVECDAVVIRYPPVLQFAPRVRSSISAGKVIIVANQAPAERDGTDRRYIVEDCEEAVRSIFGVRPLWVPQSPMAREAVLRESSDAMVHVDDNPGILDVDEWRTEREAFRLDVPVIGKHSRDNPMKWPSSKQVMRDVYDPDGDFEYRFMGGVGHALAVLERGDLPLNWVSFPLNALPVREFLNQLDFFVFFQHEGAYEAFGRAILEAAASGAVVILPPHFRSTFGPAAVYCEASDVLSEVRHLYGDVERYRRRSSEAVEHVRGTFGYDAFVRRFESWIDALEPELAGPSSESREQS